MRPFIKVNHHAPAADVPAIPQKSGGAFGIPELTPPIRRQVPAVNLPLIHAVAVVAV